jgi:hypothetical protein
MAHDVFISYSSKDKPTADAACAVLESAGIRCWIAPRDVLPGMEWSAAIVEAIYDSQIMVMVFSARANHSKHIRREVERAVDRGLVILPFRIEDVVPSDSLEYFIGSVHWLDALSPPVEQHLEALAEKVQLLLSKTAPARVEDTVAELLERVAKPREANGSPMHKPVPPKTAEDAGRSAESGVGEHGRTAERVAMRHCTGCGALNERSMRFCIQCGCSLRIPSTACQHCDARNEGGTRFCIHCGNALLI